MKVAACPKGVAEDNPQVVLLAAGFLSFLFTIA
jgi:hypothetical protein